MSRFRKGAIETARAELTALLTELAGTPERTAGVHLNLSILERRAGTIPKAIGHLRAAENGFRARGDLAGVALVSATLGGVLRDAGELAEAERELVRTVDLRTRLGDEAGVVAAEALQALVAQERGHAQTALVGLERSFRRGEGWLPRGFRALLGVRALELRARLGEAPPARREPSEDESTDPRTLLSLAKCERLAERTNACRALAGRARDLARSLHLSSIEHDARWLLSELDGKEASNVEACGPLVRADQRIARVLADGAALDVEAANALAEELEGQGRDDRAARLWLAVASRAEPSAAALAAKRADRALRRVLAGLDDARASSLRRTLLGKPDPHPSDLRPRPSAADDTLDLMAIATLRRIHECLAAENNLGSLFRGIVEGAIELTQAERGFLVLEENGELHFDLALDSARGGIARPELETSRSIVLDALERGEPLRLSNAADDPTTADRASVVSLELRSILAVPFTAPPDVRGVLILDHRLKTGAFNERSAELAELVAGMAAIAVQKVRRLENPERAVERHASFDSATGLVGSSPLMRSVVEKITRIAPSELPVLIVGASGTGKELAAQALFARSQRSEGPFVAENCAALPPSLIESELFGHRRGAFTGADRDHAGLFERAHGGTLFLDEIGELPLELQARLLRVLENGEIRRVGDDRVRRVDVRLLTATNRDLEREAREGRFRSDLLYRLDGARIELPTLEQRREDIPELVRHFLDRIGERTGTPRRASSRVMSALAERAWPGNVRELKNEVERLCVLSSGELDDPTEVRRAERGSETVASPAIEPLADLEERAILHAIEACGGDKRAAAEKLGISRAKIYQRLKEWSERDDRG